MNQSVVASLSVLVIAACAVADGPAPPLVLTPLPPGVSTAQRTRTGQPLPGVRPAHARAVEVVADGLAFGVAAAELAAERQAAARAAEAERAAAERAASERAASERASGDPGAASSASGLGSEDRASGAARSAAARYPVDVNVATAQELEALPGVGPAIAARIVDARPFANVDDLERVRGIGPATLERIRPFATASE